VIGGRCGGITLQIEEGKNGYLVDDVETAAARTADLLRSPERATAMGAAGRETVRSQFLSTRELEDWLRLYSELR
jgi:trehalose synthase